jgi:predicted transcriptional regulator
VSVLTLCPHCGKPLVKSSHDLSPKDLNLLRLIASTPEAAIATLASTLGCSIDVFQRRTARLRRIGLIDRHAGRVWATDAGRTLLGAQQGVGGAAEKKPQEILMAD